MPGMSNPMWKHTGWGPPTFDSEWDEAELVQYGMCKDFRNHPTVGRLARAAVENRQKFPEFAQAVEKLQCREG